MQIPSFLSPFLDGDSPKRLIQGLVVGAIGTMIIGFNWGGWHVSGTVEKKVITASESARVAALSPICADKFQRAAKANNGLMVELRAVKSWERNSHLKDAGWATFPGSAEPDNEVAEACATLLSKSIQ